MTKFKSVQRVILAGVFIISNPCFAGSGELDNDNQVVNSSHRSVGVLPTVIIRENTVDGTRAVAVDNTGLCNDKDCVAAGIQEMEFQDVIDGEQYTVDSAKYELAMNELNNDDGADRESWFWALLFVGAAVTAVAWNRNHRHYYNYNPYWNYNYGYYNYRAYGYYGNGYAPAPAPYYNY